MPKYKRRPTLTYRSRLIVANLIAEVTGFQDVPEYRQLVDTHLS
jgi:hypothetical protein